MEFPGLFRLEFEQKMLDTSERTLGVSGLGALVPVSGSDSSGERTTTGRREIGGALVFSSGIACCS